MALFKPGSPKVTAARASDARFSANHLPGTTVEVAGIYRCICGLEAVVTMGNPLPISDEHEHSVRTENMLGPPRWHLLVTPERRASARPAETSNLMRQQILV